MGTPSIMVAHNIYSRPNILPIRRCICDHEYKKVPKVPNTFKPRLVSENRLNIYWPQFNTYFEHTV